MAISAVWSREKKEEKGKRKGRKEKEERSMKKGE
jgi:hypothetical protein